MGSSEMLSLGIRAATVEQFHEAARPRILFGSSLKLGLCDAREAESLVVAAEADGSRLDCCAKEREQGPPACKPI